MELKDKIAWDKTKMGSFPLEDFQKVKLPADILIRRQSGAQWYRLGKVLTSSELESTVMNDFLRGENMCDRIGYEIKDNENIIR